MISPRRWMAILAVGAMVLTACNEDGDGTEDESPSVSESSGGPHETTEAPALSGELRVGAAGSEGEIAALEAVADAFMESNADVTVTLDTVESTGDFIAKLTEEFLAESPPDVFV